MRGHRTNGEESAPLCRRALPRARCKMAVIMTDQTDVAALVAEIERLRNVCGEAYQFAGAVGAPERVLDNLWAAAQGEPLPHESFLPVLLEECDPLSPRP